MGGGQAGYSACLLVAILAGCAYDSRWLQQHEEQERAAERLRPTKLRQRGRASSNVKAACVRAHATRAYATETLHWEDRFEQLLGEASEVLEPALGVRLENCGTEGWQPSAPEDRLGDVLTELAAVDPGDEVAWVVGFVESTPKLVSDYHTLGVARPLSKHLVMRASNDPRELELLTHQYLKLSEREISKLHAERKRHRMVTVFLHEIGHTLGSVHRTAKDTIMAPVYDPTAVGFDDTTLGLLRETAPHHLVPAREESRRVMREYYSAHAEGWVSSELSIVTASLPRPPAQGANAPPISAPVVAASSSSPTPRSSIRGLEALNAPDRNRYDEALAAEGAGDFSRAWKALLPIVDTNPDVLEVQDLRCRLAQKRGFTGVIADAHCAPAASLRARSQGADAPAH